MIVGPHGLTALECCATVAIVAVRPVTALPGTGVIFKPVGVTTVGPLCPAIVTHEFGIIEPTAAVVVGNLIGVGIGTELAGAGVVMRAYVMNEIEKLVSQLIKQLIILLKLLLAASE